MISATAHLDEEHRHLQEALRRMLAPSMSGTTQTSALVHASSSEGVLWNSMATELDLLGIATPEDLGGAGAPMSFLGVVLEELGRALYSGPFFSTVVLAGQALLAAGDPVTAQDVVPRLVQGKLTAAVAGLAEDPRTGLMAAGGVRALRTSEGWQLDGHAEAVWDGAEADLLIVLAHGDGSPMAFVVEGDVPGIERAPMNHLDLTRRIARIDFTNTPARPLGDNAGERVLTRLQTVVPICLAAELMGVAQRCLEIAVDYACQREQFGRKIGSFQSVKHELVNAFMDVEAARCATSAALADLTTSPSDAAQSAHLAKAAASDAAYKAATTMLQTLGGIGYTWEHPAHLYLRRAVAARVAFGSPTAHRRALLKAAGFVRG
jgi:alkylation response protein AidB-like acyl-CoA dehydrogenase